MKVSKTALEVIKKFNELIIKLDSMKEGDVYNLSYPGDKYGYLLIKYKKSEESKGGVN